MNNESLPFDEEALVEKYDHDSLQFAVAYGSGVMQQEGYSKNDRPMVDLIFAVNNSAAWHRRNIEENPRDYSFLRYFGANAVTGVQRHFASGVYYNPYVDFQGQQIKYGVMEASDLQKDLHTWKWLYAAGRMQKPTVTLKADPEILEAQQANIRGAVTTALLLLEESFTEEQFYRTIARLSYMGDPRPENPNKVSNIVNGQLDGFREMYKDALEAMPDVHKEDEGKYRQSKDLPEVETLIAALPEHLLQSIDSDSLSTPDEMHAQIRAGIRNIVRWPSRLMIVQGALSAGLNSIPYGVAKLRKRVVGQ